MTSDEVRELLRYWHSAYRFDALYDEERALTVAGRDVKKQLLNLDHDRVYSEMKRELKRTKGRKTIHNVLEAMGSFRPKGEEHWLHGCLAGTVVQGEGKTGIVVWSTCDKRDPRRDVWVLGASEYGPGEFWRIMSRRALEKAWTFVAPVTAGRIRDEWREKIKTGGVAGGMPDRLFAHALFGGAEPDPYAWLTKGPDCLGFVEMGQKQMWELWEKHGTCPYPRVVDKPAADHAISHPLKREFKPVTALVDELPSVAKTATVAQQKRVTQKAVMEKKAAEEAQRGILPGSAIGEEPPDDRIPF